MLLTIAAAIFVFGLLVLVHEFGHFITAKLTGMRVDEFAIGFGPKLCSKKIGETEYSLRIVPLGGFNDIAGMDPAHNDAGERGYCEKPIRSRMLVILAGAGMNFILPIFIFFGIFFFHGVSTPINEPVFGTVIAEKPAFKAGLAPGDRVLAVNGQQVTTWQEFTEDLQANGNNPVNLTIQRDDKTLEKEVQPTYDSTTQRAMIGVTSSVSTRYPGFFESAWMAVRNTGYIIYMMIDALYKIILELSGAELAGPIGVAQMAGEMAEMGFVPLLNFAAFLSLNLGIINLFPVPALDGGHFVNLCIEAVRGKPLSPKTLERTQMVGIALLILLMVFATKNDIVRVFTGG